MIYEIGVDKMKVTYHGHSVVTVETEKHNLIFDPFITGNPLTDLKAQDVRADVILLTHGHNDHVGDTLEIAKRNDALVVAPNELAVYLGWKGLNVHPMHIGGSHQFDFGKVKLTQAFHGSAYTEEDSQTIVYTGILSGHSADCGRKNDFPRGRYGSFLRYEAHRRIEPHRPRIFADRRQFHDGTGRCEIGCGMAQGQTGCSRPLLYVPGYQTGSARFCRQPAGRRGKSAGSRRINRHVNHNNNGAFAGSFLCVNENMYNVI